MTDYKPLYYFLFNGITDIIDEMEADPNSSPKIIQYLKILQMGAEEMYIEQEEE